MPKLQGVKLKMIAIDFWKIIFSMILTAKMTCKMLKQCPNTILACCMEAYAILSVVFHRAPPARQGPPNLCQIPPNLCKQYPELLGHIR